MELTTFSAPPTSRAARSPACWASIGLDTEPVEDHAVTDALDLDSRRRLLERRPHAVEVSLHRDVIGADLLAVGIEEHDIGLADRRTDDVGAPGGADDGIGDLRIGHQHVLRIARQIHHHRLADTERQEPGLDGAVADRSGRLGLRFRNRRR